MGTRRYQIFWQHAPPPTVDTYRFTRTSNLRSRTPQFTALNVRALYDKIKDLPGWQQMQELDPWFSIFDTICAYLDTIPGMMMTSRKAHHELSALTHLIRMGYPADKWAWRHVRDQTRVDRALAILKSHAPIECHIALPTGVSSILYRVLGPITREYTIINQAIPRMLNARLVPSSQRRACMTAKIEFFLDTAGRKLLMSRTYMRYKMIVPDLRPWCVDETILTANPQILDKDHFLQKHCHGTFWKGSYLESTTNDEPRKEIMVWYVINNTAAMMMRLTKVNRRRKHQEYEKVPALAPSLLMQLGGNLLKRDDWAHIMIHNTRVEQYPDDVEGSHGCGNGGSSAKSAKNCGCASILCTIWEGKIDDDKRRTCHARMIIDHDAEYCCVPGVTISSIQGRVHLVHADLQRQSLEQFNAIYDERDENSNRTNRHGRYSICGEEIISSDSGVDGYLNNANDDGPNNVNVNKLIQHMNDEHSTLMAPIT